ncbi:MAG: 2-oxo acid dehydrogenase subunit E2 [Alphaproteobacteria bacterium]|nr:2-oxo acid dehydrogenase subunit E2 [Alphaproteobacteria bacterium]
MTEFNFKLPDVGEGLSEGEIVRWLVKPGDRVKPDQILAEVETDKAVVEIPSPVPGTIKSLGGKPGDVLKIGAAFAVIEVDASVKLPQQKDHGHAPAATPQPAPAKAAAPDAPAKAAPTLVSAPTASAPTGRVQAAPATRKRATELGVDLATVRGSGPGGRVTTEDVERAAAGGAPTAPSAAHAAAASARLATRLVVPPAGRSDEVIPLRGIRRRIAQAMNESLTVPHIWDWYTLDATKLVEARASLKDEFAKEGVKLTYLPFFIKAIVGALKKFPSFNATLDMTKEEIVYRKRYNIGLAMATDDGLIVPVVHDADMKSIFDLAIEISELAELTRSRKISPDRLADGTFNVTNFGSYGARMGTPIIKPPQVAISGFGAIHDDVIAVGGQALVRPVLPIITSTDHRVNDGEHLGTFVLTLASFLSDPVKLLGRM